MNKQLFALVLVVSLFAIGSVPAPKPDDEFSAFLELRGAKHPIGVGSVIAEGTKEGEKLCRLGHPIRVGIRSDKTAATGRVTWAFNDDCHATVTEIGAPSTDPVNGVYQEGFAYSPLPRQAEGGGQDAASGGGALFQPMLTGGSSTHVHTGWAKHTILEQFGVTATEVEARLSYYQDPIPAKVYGGFNPYVRCYHSAFPGWKINDCHGVYSPWGPDNVWIYTQGEFDHILNIWYIQKARYFSTPTWDEYTCELVDGALPIFWSSQCDGASNQ